MFLATVFVGKCSLTSMKNEEELPWDGGLG